MWPDEPEGWSSLQARAQSETDPKRLVKIIDQMIGLLEEREGRTAARETRRKSGGQTSDSCE
jgi:hypothetical protein